MACRSIAIGIALFASACGIESPPEDEADASSGLSLTAGADTDDSGGEAADEGAAKLDVAGVDATGSAEGSTGVGCKRVDVLISIDNSGSMEEELAALAGPVFDSFPQALLDIHDGLSDFQVGVIDACNAPPYLHDTGAPGACGYSTGRNFMSSTSPDLLAEYGCVTQLVEDGYTGAEDACSGDNDDEQPANTAADAVSAPAVDHQNEGFVRDDAVLFVVAITDEEEKPIPGQSAQDVADKIIAAKGGIENVVFLGIGGDSDCEGPYGGADEAALLREIAGIFAAADRGLFWDLCDGDLEAAFQAALAQVDTACAGFEPAK